MEVSRLDLLVAKQYDSSCYQVSYALEKGKKPEETRWRRRLLWELRQ